MISVSWDHSISIHDENDPDKGILLRRMDGAHSSDITCAAFSEHLSLVATGSSDSSIRFWDFEFARPEGDCTGHSSGITSMVFVDPFPGLLAADSTGTFGCRSRAPSYVCVRGRPCRRERRPFV